MTSHLLDVDLFVTLVNFNEIFSSLFIRRGFEKKKVELKFV